MKNNNTIARRCLDYALRAPLDMTCVREEGRGKRDFFGGFAAKKISFSPHSPHNISVMSSGANAVRAVETPPRHYRSLSKRAVETTPRNN